MMIGLAGKMGSGKDYIAHQYIIPCMKKMGKQVLCMSFADQIKINVMTNHNVKFEDVFLQKTQESRRLLQLEGTEMGRNVFGHDIWIKYFDAWSRIHKARGIDCIITTDIRFKNEMQYIKEQNGVLIKVVAPKRNESRLLHESKGDAEIYAKYKEHSSECDLDGVADDEFDMVVNNEEGEFNESEFLDEFELVIQKMLDKVVHNSF